MKAGLFTRILFLVFCYSCALIDPSFVSAEKKLGPLDKRQPMASYRSKPLALSGGGQLMLISPKEWFPLAEQLSNYLQETHNQFTKMYGPIPAVETTLRLIEAETFYKETGAPNWTNAMYYKGVMSIPLSLDEPVEIDDLFRSVRHEYTHAVINALSAGRCPGWLDEGLAQESEGSVNPALEPALKKWLYFNPPISLDLLQGGFTKLESRMVAPAYGQSLFAARSVVSTFGFENIRKYFDALREGNTKSAAFTESFGVSESGFEAAFGKQVKRWAFGAEHLKVAEHAEHNHSDFGDAQRGELAW